MILPPLTFTRASTAYKSDGTQVLSGIPRYEFGHAGQGLMVEEGATNILSNADNFNGWNKTNVTLGTDDIAGPYSYPADSMMETSATGYHFIQQNHAGLNDNANITETVYVKPIGGKRYFTIEGRTKANTFPLAMYDLIAGIVYSGGAVATIEAVAGGYFRCKYTFNVLTGGSTPWVYLLLNDDAQAQSYAGDISKGVALWRAQAEEKSYPTSWQNPADGARAAEAVAFDPAYVLTPSAGALALWVYVDGRIKKNGTGTSEVFQQSTSGDQNRISLGRDNVAGAWYAVTGNAAGTTSSSTKADALADGWHRIGMRWSAAELCVFVDGVKGTPVLTPNIPSAFAALAYIGYTSNTVLDDASFWRRSISDADIAADYVGLPTAREPYCTIAFDNTLEITMSTNIRQEIIDALDARLKTILVANGYDTNLGQNVEWYRQEPFAETEYGISAEDSAAPPTWIGAQCQMHTLNVALKVVVPSTAGDAEVRTAKADVVRALGTDLTFGNLAEDCSIGESPMDVGQANVRSGGTIINLAVEYTTVPWGQ
jgi:hypothetical protein